ETSALGRPVLLATENTISFLLAVGMDTFPLVAAAREGDALRSRQPSASVLRLQPLHAHAPWPTCQGRRGCSGGRAASRPITPPLMRNLSASSTVMSTGTMSDSRASTTCPAAG